MWLGYSPSRLKPQQPCYSSLRKVWFFKRLVLKKQKQNIHTSRSRVQATKSVWLLRKQRWTTGVMGPHVLRDDISWESASGRWPVSPEQRRKHKKPMELQGLRVSFCKVFSGFQNNPWGTYHPILKAGRRHLWNLYLRSTGETVPGSSWLEELKAVA